jgi:ribosome-associated heat shock protein Hsp15
MTPPDSIRVDKWLWATRLFKTRGLAGDACSAGSVIRGGHALKPSTSVRPGDLLEIPFPEGPGVRLISVQAIIAQRVGAPEAQACYLELTTEETRENLRLWLAAKCEAAKGRPTKRNRRQIDRIHGFLDGI